MLRWAASDLSNDGFGRFNLGMCLVHPDLSGPEELVIFVGRVFVPLRLKAVQQFFGFTEAIPVTWQLTSGNIIRIVGPVVSRINHRNLAHYEVWFSGSTSLISGHDKIRPKVDKLDK